MISLHLDRKVAVVVGGGSGIGREMVRAFAGAGARVVAADLNEEAARETIAQLATGQALAASVNVRDRASLDGLMSRAAEWGGRIDILVNSAGVLRSGWAATLSEDDWSLVLDVNLSGTWRGCVAAFPYLRRQGGAIVNMSSVVALVSRPGGGAYAPSKEGVTAITRMLSAEWGRYGIRVNALAPAMIETPMTAPGLDAAGGREAWEKRIPLGRLGQPKDTAALALFLVSDAAGFISGATIPIDGAFANSLLSK